MTLYWVYFFPFRYRFGDLLLKKASKHFSQSLLLFLWVSCQMLPGAKNKATETPNSWKTRLLSAVFCDDGAPKPFTLVTFFPLQSQCASIRGTAATASDGCLAMLTEFIHQIQSAHRDSLNAKEMRRTLNNQVALYHEHHFIHCIRLSQNKKCLSGFEA